MSMFATHKCAPTPVDATVSGTIPAWLTGSFLRNGPGQFEIGSDPYRHWFDGQAQIHKFDVANGRVSYFGQPLRGASLSNNEIAGRIINAEFGSPRSDDPCENIFFKFLSRFSGEPVDDNDNVSLTYYNDTLLALTERRVARVVDLATLETGDPVKMAQSGTGKDKTNNVNGPTASAHPHFDQSGGKLYNLVVDYGLFSSAYHFFAQPVNQPGSKDMAPLVDLVASVTISAPSYVHSFGLTPNYIVLVEYPYRASTIGQLMNPIILRAYIETFQWDASKPARFFLVDIARRTVSRPYTAPAFFSFHHINSYEQTETDGTTTVHVDMVTYEDAAVLKRLYLSNLRHQTMPLPLSKVQRFSLPVDKAQFAGTKPIPVLPRTLYEFTLEMPRTNYGAINGRPYQYCYGVGWEKETYPLDGSHESSIFTRLVKLNVNTGVAAIWSQPGCHPSEPVFVPNPNGGGAEDDGVVLSVVLQPSQQSTFLLVLDARTFEPLAQAKVDTLLPLLLHGMYVDTSGKGNNKFGGE